MCIVFGELVVWSLIECSLMSVKDGSGTCNLALRWFLFLRWECTFSREEEIESWKRGLGACVVFNQLFPTFMAGTLREHRRRHTGERPYKCKYCEATFINNSSLKTHTAKHTGILPYKCQACGKLFAKSYGLKMHSLSHSNEKPFVCEVIFFKCVAFRLNLFIIIF